MIVFRALIFTAGCLAASPLLAEGKPAIPAELDRFEDRTAIARFGDCIVEHGASDAAHVLQANYTFTQTLAQYPNLIAPECQALWYTPRALNERAYLVQYAIADSLVRAEGLQIAPADLDGVPPLSHRIFGPRDKLDSDLAKFEDETLKVRIEEAAAVTTRFGECVVRENPAGAQALLSTAPDSPDEQVAFDALGHANKVCASKIAAGKPCGINCRAWFIDFTQVSYRGGVAVSYYQLAHSVPKTDGERPNA